MHSISIQENTIEIANEKIMVEEQEGVYKIYLSDFAVMELDKKEGMPIVETLKEYGEVSQTKWFIVVFLYGFSLFVWAIILYYLMANIHVLFDNIHHGETPFTLENVHHFKAVAIWMIALLLLPELLLGISGGILDHNFDFEINLMDIVLVLAIFCMAYIFEYGHYIQQDSSGMMYSERVE